MHLFVLGRAAARNMTLPNGLAARGMNFGQMNGLDFVVEFCFAWRRFVLSPATNLHRQSCWMFSRAALLGSQAALIVKEDSQKFGRSNLANPKLAGATLQVCRQVASSTNTPKHSKPSGQLETSCQLEDANHWLLCARLVQ